VENTLFEMNAGLEELRKADKELRERLFVLQVARKYDWDAANKMARRKAGEFDDPELTKVLEERERKEEKAKRNREKEKSRSADSSNSKRGRYAHGATSALYHKGQQGYQGHSSPLASAYPHEQRAQYGHPQGFAYRQQNRGEKTCFICHQTGHLQSFCPNKK
jgi:hypothetical protein